MNGDVNSVGNVIRKSVSVLPYKVIIYETLVDEITRIFLFFYLREIVK